jgi:hypothetical protein
VEIIEAALARLRWVDIRLQAFTQGPEVAAAHSLDRQRAAGAHTGAGWGAGRGQGGWGWGVGIGSAAAGCWVYPDQGHPGG